MGNSHDGFTDFEILEHILIKDSKNPLYSIVTSIYPDLLSHILDATYQTNIAILAQTMEVVDEINEYMLSIIPQDPFNYTTLYRCR